MDDDRTFLTSGSATGAIAIAVALQKPLHEDHRSIVRLAASTCSRLRKDPGQECPAARKGNRMRSVPFSLPALLFNLRHMPFAPLVSLAVGAGSDVRVVSNFDTFQSSLRVSSLLEQRLHSLCAPDAHPDLRRDSAYELLRGPPSLICRESRRPCMDCRRGLPPSSFDSSSGKAPPFPSCNHRYCLAFSAPHPAGLFLPATPPLKA
jgi:hypothetical protein